MKKFAVIENGSNIIVNVIVAEYKELAEEVTGKACIEFDAEDVNIGDFYIDGKFVKN